jgi:cell division protease FtsH
MSDKKQDTPTPGGFGAMGWSLAFVLLLLVLAVVMRNIGSFDGAHEVSYTQFKTLVEDGEVVEVRLRGANAEARLRRALSLGPEGREGERLRTRIPVFGDETLLPLLETRGVDVVVEEPESEISWLTTLLLSAPLVILVALFVWTTRASRNIAGGFGGREASFLKQGQVAEKPNVRFADVAGQENAKREVTELVDFLREPARYQRLGAEVPRGVLLTGPPGTGKTLLARALAGEAGVPFFSISASQFIEVFVGVGAARVRQLFQAAKKNAPSIVFIDELDSVGRTRGTGLGGGHDEREQTLNQILAEVDGFAEHEAVIVLAATNRPDVLDPALLRPGRFDRHVVLDLPDRNDRLAILKVHTKSVPMDASVELERLAAGTPGLSGADLKNLVNEAALLAAGEGKVAVTAKHFDRARDKLLLGTERTLAIQPEEKHRLAVHESGHTVVAHFLEHADPLYKVSIIPRGRALGGTQQLAEEERHTLPEEYLRDRLAVMLGGRTAEKELLGSVSSGADDDIRQATQLARAMVARWGMSDKIGPVDLRESEEHPFLGREIAQPRRFSESSARAVDEAVREILLEAEASAVAVVRAHRGELDELVERLEREETLDRKQIEECLRRPREFRAESSGPSG